jgi:sulfite exporter TauE/SafE
MLITAFIFGLISSFHCIGMCGPIALMLPVDRNNQARKVIQILSYHTGRLTAYGIIGLLFGLLGKGFYFAGLQQKLSLFLGILMIVVMLTPYKTVAQYNFSKPILNLISKLKKVLGSHFKKKNNSSLFIIGFLNGFLPCSMVYVALFGAVAMQNEIYGLYYMLLFGLGTVPMMSSVTYLYSVLTVSFRNRIQKIIPIVGVAIGFLFILRGMGIGIPYLSPSNISLFIQNKPNCH